MRTSVREKICAHTRTMSCPLNRNRWAGSGYTKPEAQSQEAKEMEARMKALLSDRAAQDSKYFPGAAARGADTGSCSTKTSSCNSGQCTAAKKKA